jgi:hypothetical protein
MLQAYKVNDEKKVPSKNGKHEEVRTIIKVLIKGNTEEYYASRLDDSREINQADVFGRADKNER